MGLPGSGKTLLCQQLMFARATEERPAIYLSTVSEPFEKILRYAQTLSFFDQGRSADRSSTRISAWQWPARTGSRPSPSGSWR